MIIKEGRKPMKQKTEDVGNKKKPKLKKSLKK